MAAATKDVKKIVRALRGEGYELFQRNGHIRVRDPKTRKVVMLMSSTPDPGSVNKIKADARKLGVEI